MPQRANTLYILGHSGKKLVEGSTFFTSCGGLDQKNKQKKKELEEVETLPGVIQYQSMFLLEKCALISCPGWHESPVRKI